MIQYIFIFFILLIVIFVSRRKPLWANSSKSNKIGLVLCLSLLCAMSALKGSTVGNDTHEYLRLFEMGEDALWANTRYEVGYLYFSQIVWKVFHKPQALFIVYSLIFYIALWHFIWKYSSMPWLSVLIFFAYTLFGFSMSALRQSLAIAILFVGFDFAIKKKYVLFAVTVFAASLFHSSAIFFSFSPLILRLKPSKKTIFLFIGSTFIASLLFGDILETIFSYLPYYSHYQEGVYFEGGVRLASILQLLLAILFLYVGYHSYVRLPKGYSFSDKEFLGHLVVMQMMAVALSILCLKVNILDRIVLYYSTFVLLLIPNAIVLMPYRKRRIFGIMVLAVVFLHTLIILTLRPEWNSVYPYCFYWEELTPINY